MSRTEIAVNSAVQNTGCILTETPIIPGATGTAGYSIKSLERSQDLILVVKNTGSATGPFTIKSGGYLSASIGDLTETIGGSVTKSFKIDGSRFRQTDAMVDLDSGITGVAYAVQSV